MDGSGPADGRRDSPAGGRRRLGGGSWGGGRPVDPDDGAAATQAALRILGGAAQTDLSLRRRLQGRGFSADAARVASVEMARLGYLDDAAFARAVAERRLHRGYGRSMIAAELRSRGVGENPIDDALRGVGLDDESAAAALLARRFLDRDRSRHGLDDPRTAGRVAGALARRGYGGDVIRGALRAAWAEPAEPEDGAV